MNGGVVQQVGRPIDLYQNPANLFVAGFIDSPKMNTVPAETKGVGNDLVALVTSEGEELLRLPSEAI